MLDQRLCNWCQQSAQNEKRKLRNKAVSTKSYFLKHPSVSSKGKMIIFGQLRFESWTQHARTREQILGGCSFVRDSEIWGRTLGRNPYIIVAPWYATIYSGGQISASWVQTKERAAMSYTADLATLPAVAGTVDTVPEVTIEVSLYMMHVLS